MGESLKQQTKKISIGNLPSNSQITELISYRLSFGTLIIAFLFWHYIFDYIRHYKDVFST